MWAAGSSQVKQAMKKVIRAWPGNKDGPDHAAGMCVNGVILQSASRESVHKCPEVLSFAPQGSVPLQDVALLLVYLMLALTSKSALMLWLWLGVSPVHSPNRNANMCPPDGLTDETTSVEFSS